MLVFFFDTKLFKSTNVISPKQKIPRNMCTLNFLNKCMDGINVSKFFQMKDAIDSVPFNLYDHESVPVTTYKLTKLN